MSKQLHAARSIAMALSTIVIGAAPIAGAAEMPFAEAHLFVELNHTDGEGAGYGQWQEVQQRSAGQGGRLQPDRCRGLLPALSTLP